MYLAFYFTCGLTYLALSNFTCYKPYYYNPCYNPSVLMDTVWLVACINSSKRMLSMPAVSISCISYLNRA